jgi:hypothetical protein
MRGEGQVNFIVAAGSNLPRSEQPSANFRFVGPDYFQTLQLPLIAGRSFTDSERDPLRPLPAVVSESVANRLWPGENPLGKLFSRGLEGERSFEVVGVALDARTTSIERQPPHMVYVPYWWLPRASSTLLVRATQAPQAVVGDVRRIISRVDPEIAVGEVRLLPDLVDAATASRRYQSQLFVTFACIAVFIATLGVYAVTSYTVSMRRREMNIRVALGARTIDVLGAIVRQTAGAIVGGIVLGSAGALAAGGSIAGLLYEVPARDPLVLGSVSLAVLVVGVLAALAAARRGLEINPVTALREE